MSVLLIQDYLQTQGLRLSKDEVRVAWMTAQTVMNMGAASVDRHILWYVGDEAVLAEHFEDNGSNEALLKQIFMALDSVCSRSKEVQSAVVYALMPSESGEPYLLRLVQQGVVIEQKIVVNEESGRQYLPSRTATTGWLNIANDVPKWLDLEEIKGAHHVRSQSQMALPICTENGRVLGVIQVEHAEREAFDDAAQTDWVALAIALAEPLRALLQVEEDEEQADE
ncbi:MAG: GAF domain-containing protein [Neisseria sp.]|nr:GAF domain-containing protein [Neisseria sp.]